LPARVAADSPGPVALRGKEAPIGLVALDRSGANG
jgi:hypothetical protein